jgi:phosphomannomutase
VAVISISGIRGVLNESLSLEEVMKYSGNFVRSVEADRCLLARDTRPSGEILKRAVLASLTAEGVRVLDYGVASTPAIFRESRRLEKPGLMISASHNEPEWNGLKFVLNGRGIYEEELAKVVNGSTTNYKFTEGKIFKKENSSYEQDLVGRFGESSYSGVKVAMDFGGGAALVHAPKVMKKLGCEFKTLNDSPGVFNRTIDPTVDELKLLSKVVKNESADVGFAFDCDGDRLVMVDNEGRKRSSDFLITLAIRQIASETPNPRVVASVDTTQMVEELLSARKGEVVRAKVGEANVVRMMMEKGIPIGVEGSSGGLIDGGFNYCRDSLVAAITVMRALRNKGPKVYREIREYSQTRLKIGMPRRKAVAAIKSLTKRNANAEVTDGVKIRLSARSWVLVRTSGTEEVVRVSAEASSEKESNELAQSYAKKVMELSK